GLSPAEIAAPIRSLLSRQANARVLRSEVTDVDLERRVVTTDEGDEHPYDWLVLACGARHAYFGHESWEAFAPGLKTLEQATEIRRRVLDAFEEAEKEHDPERQRALLTFAVVGGGPTGVELSGALGEMSRFTLARDFRRIDPTLARVVLIEAGPRILPSFHPSLASRAVRGLESLGVQVWTSSPVTQIDADGVEIGDERLRCRTAVWAAGVRPAALSTRLGVALDRQGRVLVGPDLSIPGRPEVFVAGDQARVEGPGDPLPGIAPVALQQGRHLARQLRRELAGRPREPFRYRDKGQMATIGRRRAVLEMGHLRMGGLLAWLAWLVVHVYYLAGFKNRVFVVLQWAWAYWRFRRGARLIVGKSWRFYPGEAGETSAKTGA
ncbi:MAG TPA: NAD(P)/FAD-dependent oxidoreductase, partial [Myxococcota bacterium]|nr:NAD(P)/FAD-dependent oxidoreductase [Myxococcota bacterium]